MSALLNNWARLNKNLNSSCIKNLKIKEFGVRNYGLDKEWTTSLIGLILLSDKSLVLLH